MLPTSPTALAEMASQAEAGFALPSSTFLYAQVVDIVARRVVGLQVTPIPVVLDGVTRTVTRKLELGPFRRARARHGVRASLLDAVRETGCTDANAAAVMW